MTDEQYVDEPVDWEAEYGRLEREHAALRKRLAAAEQREQQARAIIEGIMSDYDAEVAAHNFPLIRSKRVEPARAWLADRAEQRAAAQEEA